MKKNQILWSIIVFLSLCSCASQVNTHLHEKSSQMKISDNWEIFPNSVCTQSGSEVSSSSFYVESAIVATVPTTVLNAQVQNGIYKDIYFGDNMTKIPEEDYQQAWWYRKVFTLDNMHEAFELQFDGINYKANIWLNGKLLADTTSVNNAFKQYRYNIGSALVKGENILAVQVFPPKAGDFSIGFVDWNPSPPDQNMGIFRPVYLNQIDKVQIAEPYIESVFEEGNYKVSEEIISMKLKNYDDQKVEGIVNLKFLGQTINKEVSIAANETIKVIFHPSEFHELTIDNPQLWWPHTIGEPVLHDLRISFSSGAQTIANHDMKFGIREVKDYYNEDGHRGFMINGEKISIRGAGWVDNMTLDNTHEYDEVQLQYVKDMNMNTIRLEGFWGKDEHLYQRCDELGILIMVGWSCHWEWENYLGKVCDEKYGGILSDEDVSLMAGAWKDQILWLRNHPSIMSWFSGSDCIPLPKLEKLYFETFKEYDTSRVYLSSAKEWKSGEVESGVKMRGPYAYVPPVYWYADTLYGGAFGFNTETGPGAQVPPIESIRKMIPAKDLWPINEMWDFHCGRNEFNTLSRYTKALNERYGEAKSVEEYARKAQLLNYELMRPMFEAFSVNRYEATGVIQWMLNSAWPEMYWQLYDSYLLPNAAYFATKKAGEPIQAIYNYEDEGVYMVNDKLEDEANMVLDIRVYNIESKLILHEILGVNIYANSAQKLYDLSGLKEKTGTYFVDLRVSREDEDIAQNFYWLSTQEDLLDYEAKVPNWYYHTPSKQYSDFLLLNTLPSSKMEQSMVSEIQGNEMVYNITLKNLNSNISFFIEMMMKDQETGETILPVYWEDNYVSLLPHEKRFLEARIPLSLVEGKNIDLIALPYNSAK
ncbi:glycoside hydrolase family 2 [Lentimicrobium sp. L6]|uniref:glycoside hydrolase family 2 protein n=3 Tax=unclassified Lentimicrobium TaxID=2677434 RepID=UPI001554EBB9|nr:sugar-binding domain-containing protein [Lentimicrobium sp. L6]NPD86498.1 glycoside hydrolase family 2 [Lentimicrobium sp. L6]